MGYTTYGALTVKKNDVLKAANFPVMTTDVINVLKVTYGTSQFINVLDENGNQVPEKDGTDKVLKTGVRGLKVKVTSPNVAPADGYPNVATIWKEFEEYTYESTYEYRFEQDGIIEYGRRT